MNNRGSEWHKWDLHVHTNASDGRGTCEEILEEAKSKNICCLAVTDHHTFENVDEMKSKASAYGITIISGVEFRTEYGSESVHMIGLFPDEYHGTLLTAQYLHDNVLSVLGISKSKIIEKGRLSKPEGDDETCFKEGMFKVQVDFKSAADLIHKYGGLVTVHAGGKSNSIEVMKHEGKSTRNTTIENSLGSLKEELFKQGYIDICDLTKPTEAGFYLEKFSKPSITTSDAHIVAEVGTNYCWIKAETTFNGLKQILVEPERISFEEPTLLKRIRNNPDKFITALNIRRNASATMSEVWFDNITIPLNPGMVVIIGNKGSGKSAIADIIALCADSTNKYMSFLTSAKFRMSKPYNRSKQIEAFIQWADSSYSSIKTLDMDADHTQPERVKYIPQNFLETICTTEEDDKFEAELKNIIFQYLAQDERFGQSNLDSIINYLTIENNKSCSLIQEKIYELNKKIIALEKMLESDYKQTLENQLKYKQEQLSNLQSAKPIIVEKPNIGNNEEAIKTKNKIELLNEELTRLINQVITKQNLLTAKRKQHQEIISIKENLERLCSQVSEDLDKISKILSEMGIDIQSVFHLTYTPSVLSSKEESLAEEIKTIDKELNNEIDGLNTLVEKKKLDLQSAQKALSEPERKYQEYLKQKQDWEKRIEEITGASDKEDTIKYYQAQIEYVEHHLNEDISKLRQERKGLVLSLITKKSEVLDTYNNLFAPVVEFIKEYSSEMNDYPIEFDASFSIRAFQEHFLDYISQQVAGTFYGKEGATLRLNNNIENVNLSDNDSIAEFPIIINDELLFDRRDESKEIARNVSNQIRKGYTQQEVYDYIYGMDYVVPSFQLKMNGKPLSSLSPGERGALLLLLYLFIDMDDKPLIIDQPEENLDNESVYNYLVKFIRKAKMKRQIIIVTHNPNLAVVCDADQVIRMSIDKQNKNTVSFTSGAIENPTMNKQIVNVLEGTYPAFHNRDCKYIEKQ